MSKFSEFLKRKEREAEENNPVRIFRERVTRECEISLASFKNYRAGYEVPDERQATINAIALDVFGEPVWDDETEGGQQ